MSLLSQGVSSDLHSAFPKRDTSVDSARRRKRCAVPLTLRRAVYEWVGIFLLLFGAIGAQFVFGAVRNWSSGLMMVPVFAGILLYFIRPFWDRNLLVVKLPPSGLLFLLFPLYTLLLYPFAVVPHEVKMELLKITSYLGAYWAWTEWASRYKRWRIILGAVILLGTLAALYAVIQHANGSTMVLNMERHEEYGMRASGLFMAPAHFGAYLGTMICLAWCLVFLPAAGPLLRFLSAYGLVLFYPVLALTGSRSGWVGGMVGTLVVLGLLAWRKSVRLALSVFIGLPILSVALFATLWLTVPPLQQQITDALSRQHSVVFRLRAWSDTLNMIEDKPLFGHGPGHYRWAYAPYKTWTTHQWLMQAHNEYLHVTAEYGVVGLALLIAAFGTLIVKLLLLYGRLERDKDAYLVAGFLGALAAAMAHGMTDFNLHVFVLCHLLVLLGGVAIGALHASGLLPEKTVSFKTWCFIGGAGALFSIIAAAFSLQVGLSDAWRRLAEERIKQVNLLKPNPYSAARAYLNRAITLDPGYAYPYLHLGNIARKEAFWLRDPALRTEKANEALAYYEKAHQRNPLDADVLFGLGASWFILDDEDKGLQYIERAHRQWPTHSYYLFQAGQQLRQRGRYADALRYFRKAREVDASDPAIETNIRMLERMLNKE